MNNLTFQSPLELIFKNGTWKTLSIDQTELDLRKRLLPAFDTNNIKSWKYDSEESLKTYGLLSEFLKLDGADRFVLYCPIEIIPDISYYKTVDQRLDDFIEAYLRSFFRLCYVHDVRANFIDGDVPDIELEDRPMLEVVQAAYLVPDLINRDLISGNSIAPFMNNPAFKYALNEAAEDIEQESSMEYDINYDDFTTSILKCFVDPTDYSNVSVKRANWLKSVRESKIIGQLAKVVDLNKIVKHQNLNIVHAVIAATIDYNVVTLKRDNDTIWKWIAYLSIFRSTDFVYSLFCRLYSFGFLKELPSDFKIPKLEGDYDDPKIIANGKKCLDTCQLLSEHVFPVVILYGSRLKGYSIASSDVDKAVIMLPGATSESVEKVHEKFGDKVLKFFTEYNPLTCTLDIKNGDPRDPTVGCDTDFHILFNGLWVGPDEMIDYFVSHFLSKTKNESQKTRHLAELEKDLLQYRLLHKGYERVNVVSPNVGRTYFDVGYRSLASRLYISKVFNVTTRLV